MHFTTTERPDWNGQPDPNWSPGQKGHEAAAVELALGNDTNGVIDLANDANPANDPKGAPVLWGVKEVALSQDDGDTAPTSADKLLRNYLTTGGALLSVYDTPDDSTFGYCFGCRTRKNSGYGWDENTFSWANEHATECRAMATMERR
jgi:hypothetical protein